MVEVHFRPDGKPEEQRIADRLKPSSSPNAVHTYAEHGTGPTRTVTSTHRAGHEAKHGESRSVTEPPIVPTGQTLLSGGNLPPTSKRK
jgi:hypothetical protein